RNYSCLHPCESVHRAATDRNMSRQGFQGRTFWPPNDLGLDGRPSRPALVAGRLKRLQFLEPQRFKNVQILRRVVARLIRGLDSVQDRELKCVWTLAIPVILQRLVAVRQEPELGLIPIEERRNIDAGYNERLPGHSVTNDTDAHAPRRL